MERLKQERGKYTKKKLLDHLGKPLKAKQPSLFQGAKRTSSSSSDKKWLMIVFFIVVLLGTFIFFAAVRREEDRYKKSLYYVHLNNHLYEIQEETRVEIGMQTAVLINFREKILIQNMT